MSRHPAQLLIALLGVVLVAACGRSEAPAKTADNSQLPAPGPTRAAEIAAPLEKKLANGLRVVVLPRAGSALVAAEFLLLSGSEVDPADRPGLADFTASLLNQGTNSVAGSRSASQLAAAAEALGGPLQAQAGWDATTVGITVTTPKLAAALDLLADVVRHPAFEKNEVERYRAQAIDSLSLSLSDPSDLAPLVAARIVHGNAPYGHPRLGTPTSIQRITAAELRAQHQRWYRPDKAVLVLTGGLEPDTGFALAAQVFGEWNAPAAPLTQTTTTIAAARETPATITVIDQPDAGQAAVIAVLPLPGRAAEDYYAGLVASNVLGGGYSSRLNSEVRSKRGLSYGASASYGVLRDGGAWTASAQTKNESAAEVVGLMRSELAGLSSAAVSADELGARKASYIGSYARRLETANGIAGLIASRIAQGAPADEITRVIERVSAVDAAQVRSYATQHLQAEALRFVIVGDARQFADALKKDGQRIDVIPIAELDLEAPSLRRTVGKR